MFQFQSNILTQNPPGDYGGISVADVDGDGRFEVLVARSNGPNRILKWVGNQLRDVAPPMLADAGRSTLGFAAADIDGDGREELYLLNASADRLLQRGADGQWFDLFERPENHRHCDTSNCCGIAALDRRGVGRYGFFSTHRDRRPRLLELGADGLLSDLAQSVGLQAILSGGVVAAPIHGVQTDLICSNERGANAAYRNLGSG